MGNRLIYRFTAMVAAVCLYCAIASGQAGSALPSKKVSEFIGSTACGAFIRKRIGIPLDAVCDKIQWELTLQQDGESNGQYFITYTYGEQQVNAPGFIGGGKTGSMQGKWVQEKGTAADINASVYRLYVHDGNTGLLLVKMDENILHFLYKDRNLLIGNAGWGYTLNRKKD